MTAPPFLTTVVGSMPKPIWLQEKLALNADSKQVHGKGADWAFSGEALVAAQDDAVRLTLHDQGRAGLDIVCDGEQRRKSYVTYVTGRLQGFDYEVLAKKWTRNRRRLAEVGRCVGPVKRGTPVVLGPISQMNSLIDALRWRLCYKNQYVEELMEWLAWHTRWVNRNGTDFGSILTAA